MLPKHREWDNTEQYGALMYVLPHKKVLAERISRTGAESCCAT